MANDGPATEILTPTEISPKLTELLAMHAGSIIGLVSDEGDVLAEFTVLVSRDAAREIKERWVVRVEKLEMEQI